MIEEDKTEENRRREYHEPNINSIRWILEFPQHQEVCQRLMEQYRPPRLQIHPLIVVQV